VPGLALWAGFPWARYTTAAHGLTGLVFLLLGCALMTMTIALRH
jgi:hypothetical protein